MKALLWTLLVLLAALVGGAFLLPEAVHVERSIAVQRPLATVFTLLNGYQSFNRWSPWYALDPDATYVFSGPRQGVGARMEWSGDPAQLGSGWQEITASRPLERIEFQLDFGPQGAASGYYELRGDRLGSSLTWGFDSRPDAEAGFLDRLAGRYFGFLLERWVGGDFERGLQQFKAYAESLPPADFAGAEIDELELVPQEILYVSGSAAQDPEAVGQALAEAFAELSAFVVLHGMELAGPPLTITRASDASGYEFDAALPVRAVIMPEAITPEATRVQRGYTPGGRAVRIVHRGPLDTTLDAYSQIEAWLAANGYESTELAWEQYMSDPASTPAAELETHIYHLLPELPETAEPG